MYGYRYFRMTLITEIEKKIERGKKLLEKYWDLKRINREFEDLIYNKGIHDEKLFFLGVALGETIVKYQAAKEGETKYRVFCYDDCFCLTELEHIFDTRSEAEEVAKLLKQQILEENPDSLEEVFVLSDLEYYDEIGDEEPDG